MHAIERTAHATPKALAATVVAPTAHAQSRTTGWTTEAGLAVGGTFSQNDGPGGVVVDGESSGVDVAGGLNTGFTVVGSVGIGPSIRCSAFGWRRCTRALGSMMR